jgi:hypothetical protein
MMLSNGNTEKGEGMHKKGEKFIRSSKAGK